MQCLSFKRICCYRIFRSEENIKKEERNSTSWNTTAKKAHFVQRSFWVNFGNTNIMEYSVLTKRWCSHEMVERLSIDWETTLAVIHHDSNSSSSPNFSTEVCLPWLAKLALPTFSLITRYNMVSCLYFSHSFTNTFNNSATELS